MQIEEFKRLKKIFIVSAGRTGTQFLSLAIPKLLPNCYAVHEPDKIDLHTLTLNEVLRRCAKQGLIKLTFLKALGISGTRNYSLKRLSKQINSDDVLRKIIQDRLWIDSGYDTYIECNFQLFGLTRELLNLPNCQLVFIVREPKAWVSSWLRRGLFGAKDNMYQINLLGLKRLTPGNIGIELSQWSQFTQLDKIYWTWCFLNQKFYDINAEFPNKTSIYKFEKLFIEQDQKELSKLLGSITPKLSQDNYVLKFKNLLKHKVNSSARHVYGTRNIESQSIHPILEPNISDLKQRLGYYSVT